eukprot:822484-Pelagomonas_calceolata.AAC.1
MGPTTRLSGRPCQEAKTFFTTKLKSDVLLEDNSSHSVTRDWCHCWIAVKTSSLVDGSWT